MKLDMFRTVRDTEVQVFAEDFHCDPSVGIAYGPEQVYAQTLDGAEFELTDAETEAFILEFSRMADERSSEFD